MASVGCGDSRGREGIKRPLSAYRQVLKFDPLNSSAHDRLLRLLEEAGEKSAAERESKIYALLTQPAGPEGRPAFKQAEEALRQEELTKAAALFESILASHPEVFGARRGLAISLYLNREYERAAEEFRKLAALDPADPAAHVGLAKALLKVSRFEEALAEADQAIRLDSDSADAHYVRGWILLLKGSREEAMKSFRRAGELDPQLTPPRSGIDVEEP